jgi:predicted lipid carrier protein YhbT
MAHETLIHRVDVELADGDEATPGDPEVSADTVTEFFEIFYPLFEDQPLETSIGGSLHLHATDISDAEWTIDPGRGASSLSRQHAKADVALRGDAFDLACWTWGRLATERLEVFGDPQIAKRFQEVLRA